MITMRLRVVSFMLLLGMLAAMPWALRGDTAAQGSVPAGEYTPAFPDGPPIEIQPVITVPPETPAGVPPVTAAPDPHEPPVTAEPDPNEPDLPAPDEPELPPSSEPGELVPITPVVGVTPPGIPDPGRDEAVPVEVLPATITIRTRVCDNQGFNPYGWSSIEAFEAECPLTSEPAAFSLYTPTLALSKVTIDGVVTFEVPADTKVFLDSALPNGYDKSVSTCGSSVQSRRWGVQDYSVMTWTMQEVEAVDCTWFFVQNSDDVNLILAKSGCTWFDPGTLSTENAFCPTRLAGIGVWGNVTLSDTDPTTADIVRPASGQWFVYFNDLPPGTYTVTETNVVAGTAWTYMSHCFIVDPADGDPKRTYPLVKSTTFPVALSVPGDTTVCTSTNVLAQGVAVPAPKGGYTPGFPPIDDLPGGTEPSGIPGAMVPPPDAPTPTIAPIFPVEDPGPTTVPPATLLPANRTQPKPNIPPVWAPSPTPALIFPVETVESPVTPVPPTVVTGSGNLTIYTRTCDNQGFNPHFGGTLATFLAECPASDREFEFTLGSGSGYTKTVSTKGGVISEVVPVPGVGIQRTAVAGFEMSYTSCNNDSFNKDRPKAIAHYSGAIVAPGENVTCYYFNVLSSTDINIAVDAYTCQAVAPLTTPSVIPREFELDPICSVWPLMGGATITLADGDSSTADQSQVTTTTAGAQFIDLPVGTYTFTVAPPAGATHAYMLSCQGDWGGPELTAPVAVTATSDFTFTVPITVTGESYRCGLYVVKP